ncbi:MAG: ATP-binding protein [Gammaproteobacteria bacterium]|nr:hypothetical protein [Chromatiales bacterium]MDP6675803.1 ATP-binding protein [Gammaproteobacteria bacterium]
MTTRPSSLSVRLLVTTTLLLFTAFAVTTGLLDTIFRQMSENAIRDILEVQVLALIGVAEPGDDGRLLLPQQLPEPRLASLGSGLYAEIVDPIGNRVWRSPSAVGIGLATGMQVASGERVLRRHTLVDGSEVLVLGVGITWELVGDVTYGFQVFVGADLVAYDRQLATYRRQLMLWFTVVVIGLLMVIAALLRWGLGPLRRMADEISAIENGNVEFLSEDYPRELVGVARNMNTLVKSERQRISRFRTTMDDLAHSLKTPLAVLRTELSGSDPDAQTLRDQVMRMQGVVDYQLRRAAATGPRSLAPERVRLGPVAKGVASSLRKIHQNKEVRFDLQDAEGISYAAEQGDLYELLGNLMDNAWKWCHASVTVIITRHEDDSGAVYVALTVADDGPGIPAREVDDVLSRGIRGTGDSQRGDVPGQGIGLAVVAELVELYGGRILIERSDAGGASVCVELPVRHKTGAQAS